MIKVTLQVTRDQARVTSHVTRDLVEFRTPRLQCYNVRREHPDFVWCYSIVRNVHDFVGEASPRSQESKEVYRPWPAVGLHVLQLHGQYSGIYRYDA